METCSRCGQTSDGYPCKSCIARESRIEKIFGPCFLVAVAGICAMSLVLSRYPPLEESGLAIYSYPAIVLLPVPIGFVFVNWRRLPRYAGFFTLAVFLITAVFMMLGPYYFLNGYLDKKPSVAAQAIVSGKSRTCCNIEWTLSWNGKKIEQVSRLDPDTFYTTELDDAVRVAVHSGDFSLPWFSGVGPLDQTH